MKKMTKFRDRLKEELKKETFRKSFEEEDIYAKFAIEIARLREEQGLSQKDLARRLRTSQQTVSRLEHPGNQSFSLSTLIKLAGAFHKKLDIHFI